MASTSMTAFPNAAEIFAKQQAAEAAKKTPQQLCEESGGLWDGKNCIRAPKNNNTPAETTQTKVTPTIPEMIKNDKGVTTGVSLPDGRVLPFVGAKEANFLANKYNESQSIPEGTAVAGTAQANFEKAKRLQQLAEQGVLTQQELAALQEAPIDWGQALTAGTLGNLPSVGTRIAAGAGGGATAGAAIGAFAGGVGAVPGAIVGGIIGGIGGLISGIWSGTQANIKAQQRGEIGASQDVLTNAKSNIRQLRMIAETDPTKAEEAMQGYYFWVGQVQKAQRKIQLETQGNLNKFMEDGTDILSDFELFLMPGGYADIQKTRLEQAVMRGTPATTEELLAIYNENYGDTTNE